MDANFGPASTTTRWRFPDLARVAVDSGIVTQIPDTTICR
jgi:hypothetical protein